MTTVGTTVTPSSGSTLTNVLYVGYVEVSGIPYLYVATGIEVAEALKGQGQNAEAQKFFTTARQIAHVVRLDELLRPAEAEFAQPAGGDTGRAQVIPNTEAPAPSPAKTDTLSKPGAKGATKGTKP